MELALGGLAGPGLAMMGNGDNEIIMAARIKAQGYVNFDVALADPTITADDTGLRLVSGLVVPFGVPVWRGWYQAIFDADHTQLPDDLNTVKLLRNHDVTHPVGYGIESSFDPDGLRMTFAVPVDVPRSADYVLDIDNLLADGFSIGLEMDEDTINALTARMFGADDSTDPILLGGIIREVSGTAVPAFNQARVNASAPPLNTFTGAPTMTVESPPASAPAMAPRAVVDGFELPTVEEMADRIMATMAARGDSPSSVGHPLSRFTSWNDLQRAIFENEFSRAEFVAANQITTNNPGVIPPAFLTEIMGIIDAGRPAIVALGGPRALPTDGMTLTWPKLNAPSDISTLVGEQVTQKTEVTSVRVDITQGTAPIKTYAGYSDLSYQLIRRSSPAYREAYDRIMALAYALVTEWAFETAIGAVATAYTVDADLTTASLIRTALFGASRRVKVATGQPATAVLVGTGTFDAWGGIDGLFPVQYGVQNVSGTADASSLRINISGLEITPCDNLPDATVILTNDVAARFYEDGPFPAEAEDVAKLGTDVAIWGMASWQLQASGIISVVVDDA